MVKAKEKKDSRSYNHRKTDSRTASHSDERYDSRHPFMPNIQVFTGVTATELQALVRPQRTPSPPKKAEEVPSSSPVMTSSQLRESPPREEVVEFIKWCKIQRPWQGMEAELDTIHAALGIHGYDDLNSVRKMKREDWQSIGLKIGHHEKVRRFIKAFRVK